ncbi:hypothetical protein C0991_001762 [Blastosporella zonata]|nr:hypothetical protein C0991_001762 [Blastosporella zonata]
MSSPRLEIPQELVNKIVDEFAADATTLAHLSLVSTSFNARCREYLFSAVEFCGERPDRKHFRDFASILDNNPDVVSNIRELRLWDGNHTYGARMPWMVNDTTFHQTLRTLADNRQLTNFMWGADYHWSSLPKGLRQALLQIFSAPNLSLVRLWGLAAVPQACFASLNNLTELALTEVNIQRGNNLSAVGAPHLRMLYIADMDSGSCQNLLDAFLPHEGVFPSLVDLDINIGPKSQNDMVALKEFVRAGSQTLTGFSWVNECTSFTCETYRPNCHLH